MSLLQAGLGGIGGGGFGTYDVSVTAADPTDTKTARTLSLLIDGKAAVSGMLKAGQGTLSATKVAIGPGKHTLGVTISPTMTSAQGNYTGTITFKSSGGVIPAGKAINYSAGATPYSASVFAGLGRVILPPSLKNLGGGGGGGSGIGPQTISGTVKATNASDTKAEIWTVSLDGTKVASASAKSGASLAVKFQAGLGKHTITLAIPGTYTGSYSATITLGGVGGRTKTLNFTGITPSTAGSLSVIVLPFGAAFSLGGIPGLKRQDIAGLRAGIGSTNPITRIIGGLPSPTGPYVHQDVDQFNTQSFGENRATPSVPYIPGQGRENALYAASLRKTIGVVGVPGWDDGTPNVEVGRRETKSLTGGVADIAILRR